MLQDVYADLLFLINFSMDYLCLYICARIMHKKMYLCKMLIASAVGGIYSIVSLFLPVSSLLSVLTDCLVCLIMCTVAFSSRGVKAGSVLLCTFLYVGISMMTGGCMTALFNWLNRLELPIEELGSDGISTYLFAILAAVAGFISLKGGQIVSSRSSVTECHLKVRFCNNDFEFSGICDSGNLVRDPISGKPVVFLDRKTVASKLDISFLDDFKNGKMAKDCPCKSLRLIIVNTAAGTSAISAALPEKMILEAEYRRGKTILLEPDVLIALSDIKSSAQGYNAIVPAQIIKK